MRGRVAYALFALSALLLFSSAALGSEPDKFEYRQDSEVRQVHGKKSPTIDLKRDDTGRYTWEIKGEDTEEVIAADKRLREYIKGR